MWAEPADFPVTELLLREPASATTISLTGLSFSLGLQIAQSKSYLCTLEPKLGIVYVLGALGFGPNQFRVPLKRISYRDPGDFGSVMGPKYPHLGHVGFSFRDS